MKAYLALTLLATFGTVQSIEARPKIWMEQPDSFFANQLIIVKDDGHIKQLGIFQTGDITELVRDNKEALAAAKLADELDTSGKIFFWSGLGVGLTGAIVGLSMLDYKTDSTTGRRTLDNGSGDTTAGLITVGISLTVYCVGIIIGTAKLLSSKHHLLKSINIYNGVYDKVGFQSPSQGTYVQYASWQQSF